MADDEVAIRAEFEAYRKMATAIIEEQQAEIKQATYLLSHVQSIVEQSGRSTFAALIQDWLK